MKLVIRTVVFHALCIIIFAWIYFHLSDHFLNDNENHNPKFNSYIDYFLLSTTIQAGVGISDLYPISYYSKLVMIIQQFILILSHVITIYIFTL